jgi:hypothetical protein
MFINELFHHFLMVENLYVEEKIPIESSPLSELMYTYGSNGERVDINFSDGYMGKVKKIKERFISELIFPDRSSAVQKHALERKLIALDGMNKQFNLFQNFFKIPQSPYGRNFMYDYLNFIKNDASMKRAVSLFPELS